MAPVGQFKPNAFGLHDMTGNVWEWLADCYERSYANVPTDGSALVKDECSAYSIRGGSWGYDLPSLRSADRSDDPPDALFDGIGLRVARDLAPEPSMPDWNLRVFEDRTQGVSALYPASFTTVVAGTDNLLSVSSPYGVPRMDIAVTSDAIDVAQLAEAYVASLTPGDAGRRVYPRSSDAPVSNHPASVDTTPLAGALAYETTVDWQHPESQAEFAHAGVECAPRGGRPDHVVPHWHPAPRLGRSAATRAHASRRKLNQPTRAITRAQRHRLATDG